jgi:hypothetical protein
MSGTNQHFIPQSLLRYFGQKRKKQTRVVVYERDNIFITATTGAAAQRYFYSRLPTNSEQTLDDRITLYEPRILQILQRLHALAAGAVVDGADSAEVISHLCVRNAQMRDSFSHASSQLLSSAVDMFMDPQKRWKLMGLDKSHPTGAMLEEFNKLYDTQLMALRGAPRDRFVQMCFNLTKAKFNLTEPFAGEQIGAFAGTLKAAMPDMAAGAQRCALEKDLVPDGRATALKGLQWSVHDTDFDLILPDCIAVDGTGAKDCRAFVYAPNDELRLVLMPISSRRFIVGARADAKPSLNEVNLMFARCSWRFFVANERSNTLGKLVPEIGTVTRAWFDRETRGALKNAIA